MAREQVTPEQARYVLQKLVEQKKITGNDITSALAAMRHEINDLEARLAALRQLGAHPATSQSPRRTRTAQARKRGARSDKATASMKLQGQYLALIRRVPKKDRAKFQKIAREQGREHAITAMRGRK